LLTRSVSDDRLDRVLSADRSTRELVVQALVSRTYHREDLTSPLPATARVALQTVVVWTFEQPVRSRSPCRCRWRWPPKTEYEPSMSTTRSSSGSITPFLVVETHRGLQRMLIAQSPYACSLRETRAHRTAPGFLLLLAFAAPPAVLGEGSK
jgi:hypothetical protein